MDIPILVYTHSEYSFLWKAAIPLLQRYAAGFKIYWITDSMGDFVAPADWNVRFYDPVEPWSERMKPVLKEIPNEYVIYLQEDWLLIDYISSERLEFFVKFMKKKSCEFLVSFPWPHYTEFTPTVIAQIENMEFYTQPYHVMQPAIWKKTLLEELCAIPRTLKEYENNECLCITRTKNCMGVLNTAYHNCQSTTSPLFPHMHAIHAGEWTFQKYPCLKALLDAYGIDTTTRNINNHWVVEFQ